MRITECGWNIDLNFLSTDGMCVFFSCFSLAITIRAVRVLQTEAGLVSLGDPRAVQSQQVVMCEHLDAVIVPAYDREGEKIQVRACVCACVRTSVRLWVCAFTLAEHWLPMARRLMTSLREHEHGCHRNTSHRSLFKRRARSSCLPILSERGAFKRTARGSDVLSQQTAADPSARVLARLLCYTGHALTSLVQPAFFNSGCGAANESKEMTTLFEATRSSLGHISHSRYCGRQTAPSSHPKTGLRGALVIWQENNVQGELNWKAKCGRSTWNGWKNTAGQKRQCLMPMLLLPCRVLVNSYSLWQRDLTSACFSFLVANGRDEIKYNPNYPKWLEVEGAVSLRMYEPFCTRNRCCCF